jgi:hypothetical protein
MKKLVILSIVLMFCMLFPQHVTAANDLPPAIPSGFYGQVTGVKVGIVVSVVIGGKVLANTKAFNAPGYGIVYSIDVPMNSIKDGTTVAFKIGGRIVAYAALHAGTNVLLNLHK